MAFSRVVLTRVMGAQRGDQWPLKDLSASMNMVPGKYKLEFNSFERDSSLYIIVRRKHKW